MSFSYFDPNKEKYVTKKTEDLLLFVEGAGPQKTGNSNISNTATANPNTVDFSNIAKNFVHQKPNKIRAISTKFDKPQTLVLLCVVCAYYFCCYLSLFSLKGTSQNKSDETSLLRKKADKLSKKYLGQAKKKLEQQE